MHSAKAALLLLGWMIVPVVLTGCAPEGGAAGPLTVAAGGVATSAVLDKLDDKLTNVIQQAAAAGSLVSTKVARDLQLEVSAARQQLHDELDHNWDRLDQEKISGLREIDTSIDKLNQAIIKGGSIEDDLSLDVSESMNRTPFLKNAHAIRRVVGASQYFKTEGLYLINIKGNLFDQSAGRPVVCVGNEKVIDGSAECSGNQRLTDDSVQLHPPYELELHIAANLINGANYFDDRSLRYVQVSITQKVPNRSSSLQFWKDEFRLATYRFSLELFPKYPAVYRLTEFDNEPFIDTSKTEVAPARFMYVSGCGNDGCNAYYHVCTDIPAGAQPIQAVDFQDSFQGWGGFGPQTLTSTGICAVYWQHSHNVGRNVGFNVQYHPLGLHVVQHDVDLTTLSPDSIKVFDTSTKNDSVPVGTPLIAFGTILKSVVGPLVAVTPSSPANTTTPPIPVQAVTPAAVTVLDRGAVRLGRTYSAQFNENMIDFHLVFRTFTGEELVVTPGKTSPLVDASPLVNQTNYKAMTVSLKAPWQH